MPVHFHDLMRTTAAIALCAGFAVVSPCAAKEPNRQQAAANAAANPGTGDIELVNPAENGGKVPRRKGAQGIAILVNDEPITAYEIEQRASFIALQSGGGGADFKAKAEARWKAIVQDPKTNERFKQLLQKNNVQTQEEARALQTKYVKDLQANMVAQLKKEARQGAVSGSKAKAQQELIEEKIKLQEARKQNAITDDAEVDKIISGIAERNKMNLEQFGKHMQSMGVDISTMKARFRAEMSWREVVRKRFGHLVAITERDVDDFVATTAVADDNVELQVQRITLPLPSAVDQSLIAQRIAEADALAQRFQGCGSMGELASTAGARHEDLGLRKPATIPEPTRSLLMNASEGSLLPASVSAGGIELWALCGRKAEGGRDVSRREAAQNELRQKEFDVLAQKHLKDLRQDAAIEIR